MFHDKKFFCGLPQCTKILMQKFPTQKNNAKIFQATVLNHTQIRAVGLFTASIPTPPQPTHTAAKNSLLTIVYLLKACWQSTDHVNVPFHSTWWWLTDSGIPRDDTGRCRDSLRASCTPSPGARRCWQLLRGGPPARSTLHRSSSLDRGSCLCCRSQRTVFLEESCSCQ